MVLSSLKPTSDNSIQSSSKTIEVDPIRAVVDYNKILREEKSEEEPQEYSRHAGRARRRSELERARDRTDKNAVLSLSTQDRKN
jgi:hypothetical protein